MSWFTRCSYKYFCFTQIDLGKILQKQFFSGWTRFQMEPLEEASNQFEIFSVFAQADLIFCEVLPD